MTEKINIKRSERTPNIDWIFCGNDCDYGLFLKEKPKTVALRIISEVFGDKDLSNMRFVYVPKYYRGHNCLQDTIEVYYRRTDYE